MKVGDMLSILGIKRVRRTRPENYVALALNVTSREYGPRKKPETFRPPDILAFAAMYTRSFESLFF